MYNSFHQFEDSRENRAHNVCPCRAYGPREKPDITQAVPGMLTLLKIATPDLIGRGRVIILEIKKPRLKKVLSHNSRKLN